MRIQVIHTCLLCILGILGTHASAQTSAYRIPSYSVTHFTDDNGLPQNTIKFIALDHEGYVWLATEVGLVRYDGRHFRLFSKQEMGVRNSRIAIMDRNPRTGDLYAITEDGDPVRLELNRRRPIFVPLDSTLSNKHFSRLLGESVGVDVLNRGTPFPPFDDKPALMHAAADTFFLASSAHVACRTPERILWETDIQKKPGDFFFWQSGKLFLYNAQGVFDEVTPQGLKPTLRTGRYKKFVWNRAEKQAYVLSQKNELFLLETDTQKGLRMELLMNPVPPDFDVGSAFHVKKQIVLLGSLRQGLLVCKKQYFRTVSADAAGHGSIHYGIMALGNDIVTAKKTRISPDGTEHTLINDNYSSFNTTLARLGADTILFGQANEVLVYSVSRQKMVKKVPLGNKITCLYVASQGQVWAATADSGVYMLKNLHPVRQFRFRSAHTVNTIHEVQPGHLLLGTTTGLFSYYPERRQLVEYPQTDNLSIRHSMLSRSGNFYLCTYGDGIFMVTEDRRLIALPTDPMLYLKMAHCMLEDKNGRLWISTNKGLFCIPEKELVSYTRGQLPRVMYHYFDKENGFMSNEFNGGCQPCGIQTESGHMAFPSMNGVVVFHPDSVYFFNPAKQLDVEHISIDDVSLTDIPDTVLVERNFRQLEIYLTTPFYGSARNLVMEYTTDTTRQDAWMPVHSDRSVSLTSLPSGYSYLRFRQKKLAGIGAYNYCTVMLYKPEAFWEFPGFWGACVMGMVFVMVWAMRLRTRALQQRNRKLTEAIDEARRELLISIDSLTQTTQKLEKKTRFQQWLTSSIIHDLRGPLRFINFYAGDIQREGDETSLEQNRFLKSVYFSALKIYNYSDNLVQLLRIEQTSNFPPEKTDFFELVEEKVDQFREQAKWNRVTLLPDPDSDPFLYVNKAAFSIIIQNLLDNSIKNFKDGTVHISLHHTERHSVVNIRDEGPGLPPSLLHSYNQSKYNEIGHGDGPGLGLWLVKSLMLETGGHIRFENLPAKGLSVTLTWEIPMDENA